MTSNMLYCVQIALTTPFIFVFLYIILNYYVKGKKSVCIVVLGDIGRSPRMQYHASSLAENGFNVSIVGYQGSVPHKLIKENENIELVYLAEPPAWLKKFPGPLSYISRAAWLFIRLFLTLMLLPKSGFLLVQNPPSIPTLPVAWLVGILRGSQLVVDWHNYGYSILALKLGQDNILVSIYRRLELMFGQKASSNMCVSNAMRQDLLNSWNIKSITVYDRAPSMFLSPPVSVQHDLFNSLAQQYPIFKAEQKWKTLLTEQDTQGEARKRLDRPAILISSTSWTEDEDFGILLDALQLYDQYSPLTCPRLVCIITGKGPMKEMYEERIKQIEWSKVQFLLPWLSAEDYPVLLGCADLGVSLHKSSSGLDLPMKVVDMFGCGLPVCALHYNCIEELVKYDENGLIFKDSEELTKHMQNLLDGFPDRCTKLENFRRNLKSFQAYRWHHQWTDKVAPIFA